jgi:hypothetical protein
MYTSSLAGRTASPSATNLSLDAVDALVSTSKNIVTMVDELKTGNSTLTDIALFYTTLSANPFVNLLFTSSTVHSKKLPQTTIVSSTLPAYMAPIDITLSQAGTSSFVLVVDATVNDLTIPTLFNGRVVVTYKDSNTFAIVFRDKDTANIKNNRIVVPLTVTVDTKDFAVDNVIKLQYIPISDISSVAQDIFIDLKTFEFV